MNARAAASAISVLILIAAALMGCKYERPSLWEMKCAACHDGKNVLNDKVMPGKQDFRDRFRDIGEFSDSCLKAPKCMNILQHDEELFVEVGREIGIPYAR